MATQPTAASVDPRRNCYYQVTFPISAAGFGVFAAVHINFITTKDYVLSIKSLILVGVSEILAMPAAS